LLVVLVLFLFVIIFVLSWLIFYYTLKDKALKKPL